MAFKHWWFTSTVTPTTQEAPCLQKSMARKSPTRCGTRNPCLAPRFPAPPGLALQSGVQQLLVEHDSDPATHLVRFIGADYTDPLDLDDGEFDLLISLYAGFGGITPRGASSSLRVLGERGAC